MAGYPKHRAESWVGMYQALVPGFAHRHLTAPLVRRLPYSMRRAKILAAAAGERNLADRMRFWFGGTSVAERDLLLGRSGASTSPDPFPFSMQGGSAMRRTLFFDQTSWLPDNLLERGDRMMMAGSIEGRMPFMDTELAATVARFPDRFLTGAPGGKRVLRAVMANVLPARILHRKKVGFRVPFNQWFRGAFRDFTMDMLVSDGSQVLKLCNAQVLRTLVDEHMAGRQNNERILWSLINLEMFLRAFRPSGLEAY